MKFYSYEYCPLSARVRYVAGMLNIQLDVINITARQNNCANKPRNYTNFQP